MTAVTFQPWPKIGRLRRAMVVTEKLDGTNAAIQIVPHDPADDEAYRDVVAYSDGMLFRLYAQSRTRLITPGKATDNYGFAAWVLEHADELVKLGPGVHYGEWWGLGIQRGYGLTEKRFSLFNATRWTEPYRAMVAGETTAFPSCVSVVPILAHQTFSDVVIGTQLERLRTFGSVAAPGFMRPEGVVVYHEAAGGMFKVTLDDDHRPKGGASADATPEVS